MYLKLNFGRYTENPLLILEKENNQNLFFSKMLSLVFHSGMKVASIAKKKNNE